MLCAQCRQTTHRAKHGRAEDGYRLPSSSCFPPPPPPSPCLRQQAAPVQLTPAMRLPKHRAGLLEPDNRNKKKRTTLTGSSFLLAPPVNGPHYAAHSVDRRPCVVNKPTQAWVLKKGRNSCVIPPFFSLCTATILCQNETEKDKEERARLLA